MGIVSEIKNKTDESSSQDIATVADQLSNNETDDDKELVDFLTDETSIDKKKLQKVVKELRRKFMTTPAMSDKEAEKMIKKYL